MLRTIRATSVLLVLTIYSLCQADITTRGINGINEPAGYNGSITIGQVESKRPGDKGFDTDPAKLNSSVDVTQVFFRTPGSAPDFTPDFTPHANTPTVSNNEISAHAVWVAGIINSTDPTLLGVAPAVNIYSVGVNPTGPDYDSDFAISAQYVIIHSGAIRVMNVSAGSPNLTGHPLNGDELFTQFVDWAASANGKDILFVLAGNEGGNTPVPTDNFNGMTIGYSERIGNVWRKVGSFNSFNDDANGDRTSVSLLAPGEGYPLPDLGSLPTPFPHPIGTSFAAPQVSGAAAVLQQFAFRKIDVSAPHWDLDARRHQVIKAVLMNSADKLIDDHTVMVNGNLVPQGGLLGMQRTVETQTGGTWLDSDAYHDGLGQDDGGNQFPLDMQMGAGELNVTRAIQQFQAGKYASNSGDVPDIAWDFGHTVANHSINVYPLAGTLTA